VTIRLTRKALICLVAGLFLAVAGTAVAASVNGVYKGFNVVKVNVDGRDLVADVPAIIMDGRTLTPARLVAEALGATVTFNQDTYTVSIKSRTAPSQTGLREGFVVSDKDVGLMTVAAVSRKNLFNYTAAGGSTFIAATVIVKNFSEVDIWVSPETFYCISGDKKWEYSPSVTFSNNSRLVPKAVKPGDYASGLVVWEVPINEEYFLAPTQVLYNIASPKVPIVLTDIQK